MKSATLHIHADQTGPTVNPNVYGHFAEHLGRCIYEGFWVGEESPIPNERGIRTDVVEALKALNIPVLRWPGGCFADEYHWRDGVGPRESRPSMINTHWGGVTENNHFGTHEFLTLCEQLGTHPYVCGNVGSGTVQEMSQWVEYITSDAKSPMADLRRQNGREDAWRLPFFGVGNENWGCGGHMRPEYYADLYRHYNTYVRTHGSHKIFRIACGANASDTHWTDVLMERAKDHMDGLSLHYYTLLNQTWPPGGYAADFDETQWFKLLKSALHMDDIIAMHRAVMDRHDPAEKVGMVIDEWGTWHAVEPGTNPGFLYQQNTMRDALVAAVHFHIFHRHASRVVMANLAQTVNVLMALVLTDGPKMLRTPTYWVFEMFKVHQGGVVLPVDLTALSYDLAGESIPMLSASATRRSTGEIDISIANLNPKESAEVILSGATIRSARVLTAPSMQAHNTFDEPDAVIPADFPVSTDGTLLVPPMSVVSLVAG